MPIPPEEAGRDPELWMPGRVGACMVCGQPTQWAYLSFGFMHPDGQCPTNPREDLDSR